MMTGGWTTSYSAGLSVDELLNVSNFSLGKLTRGGEVTPSICDPQPPLPGDYTQSVMILKENTNDFKVPLPKKHTHQNSPKIRSPKRTQKKIGGMGMGAY